MIVVVVNLHLRESLLQVGDLQTKLFDQLTKLCIFQAELFFFVSKTVVVCTLFGLEDFSENLTFLG